MVSDNSLMMALPVRPASSVGERQVDPVCTSRIYLPLADSVAAVNSSQVFINPSTFEEIIECIINTHENTADDDDWGSQPLLCFHWDDASQAPDLSERLWLTMRQMDKPKIWRFEYDYASKTVFLKIADSEFRCQVHMGLDKYINIFIQKAKLMGNDLSLRRLIRSVHNRLHILVAYDGKLCKQPDISFGRIWEVPSMVCEVS